MEGGKLIFVVLFATLRAVGARGERLSALQRRTQAVSESCIPQIGDTSIAMKYFVCNLLLMSGSGRSGCEEGACESFGK